MALVTGPRLDAVSLLTVEGVEVSGYRADLPPTARRP
jgi:hypothetical protein